MTWESGEYYNKHIDTHVNSLCTARPPIRIRQKSAVLFSPHSLTYRSKAQAFKAITKRQGNFNTGLCKLQYFHLLLSGGSLKGNQYHSNETRPGPISANENLDGPTTTACCRNSIRHEGVSKKRDVCSSGSYLVPVNASTLI